MDNVKEITSKVAIIINFVRNSKKVGECFFIIA